jgi:NADH-quinone oxidoreductase subunit J
LNTIFYIASAVALFSTGLAISRKNAIHAILNLILSLLAISVIFYILGAPFIAALEVIIYAGAIMVLFIFIIMMLNIGIEEELENKWLTPKMWILPSIMAAVLLVIFIYAIKNTEILRSSGQIISPKEVSVSLFTTYMIGVEISAILLLAGIIGAYHLGRPKKKTLHRFLRTTEIPENENIEER